VSRTSLFSDELLRQLIAVGHVDVIVGLPTHDNAATVVDVVRAVQAAFVQLLPRERTVLVALDGGSTDGTAERLRLAAAEGPGTLTTSHGLRTTHQVNAPYHGVPGKGAALRVLFAAADLLQARAVVVVAPDLTSLTPEWIAKLARPVLAGVHGFVSPIYARHPLEAPLVTQVVRPVIRATHHADLREPLASDFGCSRAFATHCLAQPVWESELGRSGVDLWLTATALANRFDVGEVVLGPRVQASSQARLSLSELLGQVVGALFTCVELHEGAWRGEPIVAQPPASLDVDDVPPPPPADTAELVESFRRDVVAIRPVLGRLLSADTLARLMAIAGAEAGPFRYPDDLWVATVYEFAASYHRSVIHRQHVTRALVPLYLGRVASFLAEHAEHQASTVWKGLEALCQQYERALPDLAARWSNGEAR
jgi:glycosyltransferase involved in cell wall biosynthesis